MVFSFREEWEWVRKLSDQDENFEPSEAQLEFQKDLIKSSQRLLDVLGKFCFKCSIISQFIYGD